MSFIGKSLPKAILRSKFQQPPKDRSVTGCMMNHSFTVRRQFVLALGLGFLPSRTSWGDEEITSSPESAFVDWQELAKKGQTFEHWTPEEDGKWKSYRAERYVDGNWKSVAISLPVNVESGESFQPAEGYVSLNEVPSHVLSGELPSLPESIKRQMIPSQFDSMEATRRLPDPQIRIRDGKPPSDWLRSLHAEELRTWLKTIDTPEATVNGMTFWVHLVRDHSFDPRSIEGLTEREFLLLHSAAHFGY